jgi:5-formyltetrahydrofolate cyclo-ligase
MTDKIELRKKAKNIRKKLPMKQISTNLVDLIMKNDIYINSKNIMLFYPTEFEVDLRELFNDNKNFYLPKVEKKELLVCPYTCQNGNADLQKSSLGIYEPNSSPVNPDILDLIVVPALMCDKNGYRLGYGGGFYDRFIKNYGKNFKTICPVPKELFTTNLPHDEFDQKVDVVIKV